MRAAMVGGGAYAVGKRRATVSGRGQLNQLAILHEQGALTDDEFATAKARLLSG
ncbi:MAG TPA: SHOCT domain-containing protein [Chloroflexota bacterium]|nr:SHOCT domain-containing protein [Chloroflexota bacterium]